MAVAINIKPNAKKRKLIKQTLVLQFHNFMSRFYEIFKTWIKYVSRSIQSKICSFIIDCWFGASIYWSKQWHKTKAAYELLAELFLITLGKKLLIRNSSYLVQLCYNWNIIYGFSLRKSNGTITGILFLVKYLHL